MYDPCEQLFYAIQYNLNYVSLHFICFLYISTTSFLLGFKDCFFLLFKKSQEHNENSNIYGKI